MTISELSHTVHALVSVKNYQQALVLFKQHKTEIASANISANEYLVADIITSLRGIKAYEAGFKFLKIYNIPIDKNTPIRILNSYGWLFYSALKEVYANAERNPAIKIALEKKLLELMGILRYIIQNETDFSNIKFSINLVEYLFKIAIQQSKTESKPNNSFLTALCENIFPEHLSENCFNIQVERKGQIQEMELASAREEWYATYSKSLIETERYSDCINVCNEAIEKLKNLHYNNEIWFKRRQAQCYRKMQNIDKSLEIYEYITAKKADWFILKELSECYFANGNTDKALEIGQKAASAYGPINFKVELIEMLGDILEKTGKHELALKHYLMVKTVREAEKWQANNVLNKKIELLLQYQPSNNYTKETLKKELTEWWNNNNEKSNTQKTKLKGIINKLLNAKPQGTDGFIKTEKNETYYFFLPASYPQYNKLKTGQKVEFIPEQAQKGLKAIKLKFID